MAYDYSYGYYPYGSTGYNPYSTSTNPYGYGTYNPYTAWSNVSNTVGTDTTNPNAIYFPTATEATTWAAGTPGFQTQANILGNLSSAEGFQNYLNPYINEMLTSIGRSGLPSSSYADRMIANTLGDVYSQYATNVAGAWNDYNTNLGNWAAGYAQYPMSLASLLQG